MSCDCPVNSLISVSERLLFVARGAAAICYVIFAACLWQLFRHRSTIWDMLQNTSVVAAWTRMVEELGWTWFAVPDEHTRKVRDVMDKLREDRCRKFMLICLCWSVTVVLYGVFQIHVTGVWSDDVDLDSLRDVFLGGPFLMQILVAAVAVVSPFSSKAVNAQAVHVAYYVASMCMQWLHDDVIQHLIEFAIEMSGRIFFAAFLGTPGPVFMLNAVALGNTLIRSLDSDEFPGLPVRSAALCVCCAVFSQKVVQSEARATVAAKTSASTETAVQDLLGIMCDAVVVLDEHLVIALPCPKLDALLLRCAPVDGGYGGFFPSLFHGSDQVRVDEFLAGCVDVAQSLHAHLRDVRGSPLDVQLFHKRFEDVFGKSRHVIGVVEAPDTAHAVSTQENLETSWVGSSSSHQTFERRGMNRSGNSSNGDSSSGESSCSSSEFVPFHTTDEHNLLEIHVDTTTDRLQILTCTPSVISTTGPVENGKGLLDLVAPSSRAPLFRWVLEGGTDPKRVTLQHTSVPRLSYRATCTIRDDADAPAARRLVLSDLRCRYLDSASRRQARRTDIRGTERLATRRMSL